MNKRIIIYARLSDGQIGTHKELLHDLRQAVVDRGDVVVDVQTDDGRISGKGKHAGWYAALTVLNTIDEVVIASAGDLPGRTMNDLFHTLGVLRSNGVTLCLPQQGINTGDGSVALLDLIAAYRAAKLSQAIRSGQAKARAIGKRIGRPMMPRNLVIRIEASLAGGGGIRPTARRFNVSPASVINIRRAMSAGRRVEAA